MITTKFREMNNKLVNDFKAEGYPKSDKYLLDFVETAVKDFSNENAGYLLTVDTGNGEVMITLSDLRADSDGDGSIYQSVINAETKRVRFIDLEKSNYSYESSTKKERV